MTRPTAAAGPPTPSPDRVQLAHQCHRVPQIGSTNVDILTRAFGRSAALHQVLCRPEAERKAVGAASGPPHWIFGRSARVRVSLVAPGLWATSAALRMMAWIALFKNRTS